MMHRRQPKTIIRQLVLLIAAPLLLVSSAYALFSQQLSINATGSSVGYVANNAMFMTYGSSSSLAGSTYTYTIDPLTVYNNSTNDTADWTVTFTVPADVSSVTCTTTIVSCSFNNVTDTVTIKSILTNGWIVSGGSLVTTGSAIKFSTSTARYSLQNISVTSSSYQAITGLSTSITRTRSGQIHTLTITITTAAGVTASGWQIQIPTTQACTLVTNLPANVTYTCTASALYLSAPAYALTANNTITVSPAPKVTYGVNNWVVTGATIKGKY